MFICAQFAVKIEILAGIAVEQYLEFE